MCFLFVCFVFYSVALKCFLLLIFFFSLFLAFVFLIDVQYTQCSRRVRAVGLCCVSCRSFPQAPEKVPRPQTGGFVDQPTSGQLGRHGGPAVQTDLGPRPPASPACIPLRALCMQGTCFLQGAPTPVRRAGGIPGPLLTGHSQEGPRHMSHAPHQTPGSSPEGCGAGHRSCPSTFSPEPRPSHSRPGDPGSHRWFPRR